MLNLVYYSQEDKRWAGVPFTIQHDPSQTIGTSACGPTSFAMAASSLLGRVILPPEAAKYAVEHGYRTDNSGTMWTYFGAAAKAYGLKCKQTSSFGDVSAALASGALVIASMRSGHFTGGGHFVLLVGAGGDWVDVYDPNQDNRKYGTDGLIDQGVKDDGKVRARSSVIIKEAAQYWIITGEEVEHVTKEDAEKIISLLSGAYGAVSNKEARDEIHRLANEVRKAAGMPQQ